MMWQELLMAQPAVHSAQAEGCGDRVEQDRLGLCLCGASSIHSRGEY